VLSLLKKLKDEGLQEYSRIVFYLDNATYHTTADTI
jgi:hypothetical protein